MKGWGVGDRKCENKQRRPMQARLRFYGGFVVFVRKGCDG